MSHFGELLEELSERLNMDLVPDQSHIVTLLIENKVRIQIQPDSLDEYIILGAFIAELPPGKFREHILRDGLKANFALDSNPGILSYHEKKNMLMLHMKLPISSVNSDDLVEHLKHLKTRAIAWQEAIDEGRSSPKEELPEGSGSTKKSIFGF